MPNKLREMLNSVLDEMIGDPDDIVSQCGGSIDYDDLEWEDDDDYEFDD